ncbi:hypothetical protein [Kitasatospora sp. LaBMicrA B282]|uniref:hypothetical protein n=1 Tax=Kitasatospora sp. LaBMicrA B282 TaxID=3420949 RepID=UPI003D0DA01A
MRRIGRVLAVVGEVVLGAVVLLLTGLDALTYAFSHGSDVMYTGQADDQEGAIRLFKWGVLPGVLLIAWLVRVEVRRYRRKRGAGPSVGGVTRTGTARP